jgi:hypothetical protein
MFAVLVLATYVVFFFLQLCTDGNKVGRNICEAENQRFCETTTIATLHHGFLKYLLVSFAESLWHSYAKYKNHVPQYEALSNHYKLSLQWWA